MSSLISTVITVHVDVLALSSLTFLYGVFSKRSAGQVGHPCCPSCSLFFKPLINDSCSWLSFKTITLIFISVDFQENDNLSSLQGRPQIKQPNENRKKLASATKDLVTASQHPRFQPIVKLARIDVIKTQGLYNLNPIRQQCNFSKLSHLETHMIGHGGQGLCRCLPHAGHSFDKSSLFKHKIINTGEKPYCCSECGKWFSKTSILQTHMRMHTGEQPFSCFECGKRFSQTGHLQTHMRVHTGEQPFSCSQCGKQFSDSSNYRRHLRVHTGEKPYCCPECGKRFSDTGGLMRHAEVHSKDRPYACSECGKKFSRRSNLHRHIRTHV
uniref:C2H2-type domain-containing protein n=1 Tax=Erpetoichthys calabaricus TaxID=27687 RepID=A0A8C4T0G8_ERPCA